MTGRHKHVLPKRKSHRATAYPRGKSHRRHRLQVCIAEQAGVPDRLVVLPGGRVLFVECKAPGQKARPSQRREHDRLRALGGEVIVLDDRTPEIIF
ncbi:hypothetical phage protein [Sodalis glossinidius str. 'morsitans']|uniref:Hypothetical phage protein n=1 Tax=Sodalis glossinidius (strain morsitans) TaxID=343509 RepID=Q2NTU2_SODGM|nr:hypothetical phage protein [Sodalis glossinidius str. 'morsitans']